VLVAINGLFLLCLSFLPFPTGIQAVYREDELAMVFYGVANMLCGLSLLSLWLYAATGYRLVDEKISPLVVRSMTRRLMIAPGLSLLAIGCSFISIPLSRVVMFSVPFFYLSHRVVDSAWQKMKSDDDGQ
jgi:uncharacterized membrane protein